MGTPLPIQAASLGMADSLILMVLALVVFGPRRLPQIGRQIGKLMYEFRKASNDFKFQMEEELRNAEEADRRKKEEERLRALALAAPAPESPASETQPALPAEVSEAAAAANPYPWDSVYPPVPSPAETPAETPAARSAEPEPAAAATEPQLVLQPPSTGETVPAAPPRRPRRKKAAPAVSAEPDPAPVSPSVHVLEAENMPPLAQPATQPQTETPAPEQAPHG